METLDETEVARMEKLSREQPSLLRTKYDLKRGDITYRESIPPREKPVRLLVIEAMGDGVIRVIPCPQNDRSKLWDDQVEETEEGETISLFDEYYKGNRWAQ